MINYTQKELMVVAAAREIRDGEKAFVGDDSSCTSGRFSRQRTCLGKPGSHPGGGVGSKKGDPYV